MTRPTVIILKGLPASGKTTWALAEMKKHPNKYKRVSKDDLRAMLDNGVYSKVAEGTIRRCRDEIIQRCVLDGYDVIVDDTNLNPEHEEWIRWLMLDLAAVEIHIVDTSLNDCIERDAHRDNPVGAETIRRMYEKHFAIRGPG